MYKKIHIDRLFPCPPSKNYDNLMIDYRSIYHISLPSDTIVITAIIESHIPKNLSMDSLNILDCTACVGGDTISFGKMFGTVVATEIEPNKYNMLSNNVKEFELYNVVTINDDCIKILNRLNFIDIVYFDPPWGGRNYKEKKDIRLSIGDIYIDDLINIVFDGKKMRSDVKMVVLKLPKNYNLYELYKNTKHNDVIMYLHEMAKMYIVVFKKTRFVDS